MANPIWNMLITMSTVGYGDIFPQTLYGRMFSVLAMFSGQFCNTLILLAMRYIAELSMQHTRAFQTYKKVEFLMERARNASDLMGKLGYIYLLKRDYRIKKFEKEGQIKALTRLQTTLRVKAHKQRLAWSYARR